MNSTDVAYVDTSAFVKLFAWEAESEALRAAVSAEWPTMVASEILAIEASRVARRIGGEAPANAARMLRPVALLPLSTQVRLDSCRADPPELRSLDAIHLATAISVSEWIGAVLTYDSRLAAACGAAGLRVLAPSA